MKRHSKLRAKSCRGRLLRLPACHDDRHAKRAGTEACPYDWLSEIQKALVLFDGRNPFGLPVRLDTATLPYTEFIVATKIKYNRPAPQCEVGC